MRIFIAMFVSYLIGSIPAGYIFAKLFKGVDIRTQGSKNVGATNVYRVAGKVPGLCTLIFDFLKGALVVSFGGSLLFHGSIALDFYSFILVLGLCVVAGHNWPIFLSFKGGKGVATSAGILLVLCPALLAIGLAAWALTFAVTRLVSLASLLSSTAILIGSCAIDYAPELRFFIVMLWGMVFFQHRTNIERLITGKEEKIK